MDPERKARTAILYGDSGNGKTSSAYFVAERLARETDNPVRVISFENSSATVLEPLIASGAVDYLSLEGHAAPMAALRQLARGAWRAGDKVQQVEEWRGKVGGYVIEGLTTAAEALLEQGRREGRMMREQKADAFEIAGEKFNPASQSLFGLVQREMLAALQDFGGLPVPLVLWTAHESSPALDNENALARGPALVGRAKNASISIYTGTLLHLDVVKGSRVCFFNKHADPSASGLYCPAKATLPPARAAALARAYPSGGFPVTLEGGEVAEFIFGLGVADASAKKEQVA